MNHIERNIDRIYYAVILGALQPEGENALAQSGPARPDWETAYIASTLALNTTMRGCEIKQLCWRDIDFIDHSLVIRRSRTQVGERLIPLNANAYQAIIRLRERARTLFGSDLQPDWYLFPRAEGYSKPSNEANERLAVGVAKADTRAVNCPVCGELQDPAETCRNVHAVPT